METASKSLQRVAAPSRDLILATLKGVERFTSDPQEYDGEDRLDAMAGAIEQLFEPLVLGIPVVTLENADPGIGVELGEDGKVDFSRGFSIAFDVRPELVEGYRKIFGDAGYVDDFGTRDLFLQFKAPGPVEIVWRRRDVKREGIHPG